MGVERKSVAASWPWREILLIALAGLATHGLVMFTDHVVWDGIWINKHLKMAPRAYEIMERMWWESGRGYELLWLAPMKGVANPAQWSKILSVAAWVLSAVFFFLFLRWTGRIDPALSLMAALLAVCAPFVDLLGDLLPYLYVMPVCAFWGGMAALVAFPRQETQLRRVLVRLLSLVLLFVSFSLPSNLVMFCAVFALFLVLYSGGTSLVGFLRSLWLQLKSRADFAALPFISWVVRRTCFPTYGNQTEYNAVKFDLGRIIEVYGTALRSLPGKLAINLDLWWIWGWALLLGVCAAALVMRNRKVHSGVSSLLEPFIFLAAGVALWLAAVFPYAAVGQYIHAEGWSTRNAILFNVPLGIFCAGACALLARIVLPLRPRAAWLPVAVVAGLGMGMANAAYLRMQAYGAKQRIFADAVRAQVANQNDVSLVQLRDYFNVPHTFDFYPPAIWTHLGAPEMEMPRTLILDTMQFAPDEVQTDESGAPRRNIPEIRVTSGDLEQLIVATTMPYAFEAIPPRGRQFLGVIAPGELGSDPVRLGAGYLMTKYFQKESLPAYLSRVATVQFREINGIQP